MALYFYRAISKDGKNAKGQIEASTLQQAKELLVKKDLFITELAPAVNAAAGIPWYKRLFEKKIKLQDKILFTKQLAVLLKNGVPLLQALELLMEQFTGSMHLMIVDIKDNVKEGQSFADALKKYPKVFENIYVQLVRAGEATGKLEVILDQLVVFLERRAEIQAKVSKALRNPMIQIGGVVLIVIFLMVAVVPKLAETFAGQGAKLPATTQLLMSMTDLLVNHYVLLLIAIAGIVIGFSYMKRKPWGRRWLDSLKLKIPIIKFFTRMNAIVSFCRTLGMLLEGGVSLPQALDIVCSITGNTILADALEKARDKIIKEGNIAQYLKQTNIFPPLAIYLIKTGEQSGELGAMLLTVAATYEKELAEYSDLLTELLKPFILVFMAVVVGFIVMAIAQPISQMGSVVSGIS